MGIFGNGNVLKKKRIAGYVWGCLMEIEKTIVDDITIAAEGPITLDEDKTKMLAMGTVVSYMLATLKGRISDFEITEIEIQVKNMMYDKCDREGKPALPVMYDSYKLSVDEDLEAMSAGQATGHINLNQLIREYVLKNTEIGTESDTEETVELIAGVILLKAMTAAQLIGSKTIK